MGAAAEAYNGAVYELGLIDRRIATNRAGIIRATNKLHGVQTILGERLRAEYMRPQPTPLQLLLSTGSASAVVNGTEAMDRAAIRDSDVIRTVKALRAERVKRAQELKKDQAQAKIEVADKAHKRDVVLALLSRRQSVLAGAKGALKKELDRQAALEAARRREANRRAQALMAAQRNASSGSIAASHFCGTRNSTRYSPTSAAK